jgi:hypothetical protein
MSGGYFVMEARLPDEPKPDVHLFVVFENDVSAVHFDGEDDPDVCYIEDERLDDENLWKDPHAFFNMFINDVDAAAGALGKRIIVLHYNPAVAQCVKAFFKYFEGEERIQWHALSFFHTDKDTEWLGLNWSDVLLAKFYAIDSMNHFPWIKKLEVRPDAFFYHRDLLKLVLDKKEFKRLNNEDEEPYARMDNDKPPQITWSLRLPEGIS